MFELSGRAQVHNIIFGSVWIEHTTDIIEYEQIISSTCTEAPYEYILCQQFASMNTNSDKNRWDQQNIKNISDSKKRIISRYTQKALLNSGGTASRIHRKSIILSGTLYSFD